MSNQLPRHLTEEQVKEYARQSETMLEFQQSCRVGRHEAKRILIVVDKRDAVAQGVHHAIDGGAE